MKQQQQISKLPIAVVVQTQWRTVLLCMGANVIGVSGAWFVNTFMLSYTTQTLHFDRAMMLSCLFIVAIIQLLTQLASGWVADGVGNVRFLKAAAFLAMLSPFPMFLLVQTGRPAAIVVGIGIAVMCMSSSYAVMAGFMTEAFPVRVRYSAISLSYQLCAALGGGLTPLIGTLLVHQYAQRWWPLAVFYSVLAAITLLCISAMSRRRSLAASSDAGPLVEQRP